MTRPPHSRRLALGAWFALATPALTACDRIGAPSSTRTLASGLRIVELAAGAGATAEEGRWVEVQYDARVVASEAGRDARTDPGGGGGPPPPFDSTRDGDPFVFRIGRSKVLAAFAEGVTGMREGGRRRLLLPPALAYGALGKGPIPPDATLEYDVELVRLFGRSEKGVDCFERRRGSGPKPRSGQRVMIRCRAWLVESGRSILDAKRARDGFVVEVGAGQTIPAIEAVLPEMNVGAIWRLGVPPELGYGVHGQLPILVPGQDFVLDLELVAIQDKS